MSIRNEKFSKFRQFSAKFDQFLPEMFLRIGENLDKLAILLNFEASGPQIRRISTEIRLFLVQFLYCLAKMSDFGRSFVSKTKWRKLGAMKH